MSNPEKISTEDALGDLMFRCPSTGKDFKSGFVANHASLAHIGMKSLNLFCHLCGKTHIYRFREAQISMKSEVCV
jgi:hypothetical protein